MMATKRKNDVPGASDREPGKSKTRYVLACQVNENRRIDELCTQVTQLNLEVAELCLAVRELERKQ